ncbi:MAG: OmpA family protein [Thiobacillus sp.]|uniref:OmpA family protein n=1 Tax=Thiobacillus sp. TaxID=924 RepID=UPI002894FBFD|nr:OmpA family protein [Thiobacillus sp.]MDT3706052.1 OmpA family protein [Thiobacillus sp.]
MRTPLILSILGATLVSAGALTAHAAEGASYYNPSNAASASGKTVGHELFLTIGCPGRGLLDAPCPKLAAAPVDSDGDGVVDGRDKCPNTPAGRKVNADGCELDSDGDGVVDGSDKCPNTAAGRKVNADGCELDSDGDGVVDGSDRCPNTPAGRKVNADGCELDSDNDGIVDGADKCPTVYAKTADGCPEAAPKKLVLEGVTFDNNQASLKASSFATLDEAAATLKEWGDVRVEIGGHTDSVGKDSYNLALSQRRAETVRQYLIGKGVAANRLFARGYGETRPVADNATAEGRDKNRRVELVAIQ